MMRTGLYSFVFLDLMFLELMLPCAQEGLDLQLKITSSLLKWVCGEVMVHIVRMYIQYLQYITCSTYNTYSTWRVHRHFSMCSWCMQHTFPVFRFTSNVVVVLWYSSPVWEMGRWVIFPQNGWPLKHWVMSTAAVYLNMHVDNVNAAVNLFGHSLVWYARGS